MESNMVGQIRLFVALADRKDALETELKQIKAQMAAMKPSLSEQMLESGMQSTNIDGRTVYLQRQLWASFKPPEDQEDIGVNAFLEAKLGWLVKATVNSQTLSAYVREQAEFNDAQDMEDVIASLPEQIRPFVKVSEVFDIRARKAQ